MCSPLYDRYARSCDSSLLNRTCETSCLWLANALLLNSTGFVGCKCYDNNTYCRNFKDQCRATCSPAVSACLSHSMCAPLIEGVISKCNLVTSIDCNQGCWTNYTAATKSFPILTVLHECDCGRDDVCNRVKNAIKTCDSVNVIEVNDNSLVFSDDFSDIYVD